MTARLLLATESGIVIAQRTQADWEQVGHTLDRRARDEHHPHEGVASGGYAPRRGALGRRRRVVGARPRSWARGSSPNTSAGWPITPTSRIASLPALEPAGIFVSHDGARPGAAARRSKGCATRTAGSCPIRRARAACAGSPFTAAALTPRWRSAGSCALTTAARAGNWPRAAAATLRSTSRSRGTCAPGLSRRALHRGPPLVARPGLHAHRRRVLHVERRRPDVGAAVRLLLPGRPGSTRTTRSTSS